jgi:hypothetical protein
MGKARCRRALLFSNSNNNNTNTNINTNTTKISLSIVRNTFVISHNNASEFSMLQDFEELKNKISIVGKSFVTLGKP